MPCSGVCRTFRVDYIRLTKHLLDLGLVPKSGKWIKVWHDKKSKFGTWV